MTTLNYASRNPVPPNKAPLLPFAVYCWGVPCAAGILIYVLFLTTQWASLALFGMSNIIIGMILCACGAIALICYLVTELRAGVEDAVRVVAKAILIGALLLSNFPLAAAIVIHAARIMPMQFD